MNSVPMRVSSHFPSFFRSLYFLLLPQLIPVHVQAQTQVVEIKSTYVTTVSGSRYFVAEFRKAAGVTLSFELSNNLAAGSWGAPGTAGRPEIVGTISPTDPLVTVVRIDQPLAAGVRYFLRARGQIASPVKTRMDFDGDGRTDLVVVRNTGGGSNGAMSWIISLSGGGSRTTVHGLSNDSITPGDFDGDGRCDPAVWRASLGQFLILQSSTQSLRTVTLGQSGDIANVCADYDGDGKTDPAVYRTGSGQDRFLYLGSLSGLITTLNLTTNSGFPNPGDFDGDGKADPCAQIASGGNGIFVLRRSSDSVVENVVLGAPTDSVSSGDFDRDGKEDFVAIRSSGGTLNWRILERDGGGTGANPILFGNGGSDFTTPGDYDGDGKMDIATWRAGTSPAAGTFQIRRSSDGGTTTVPWGQSGDYPVANTFVY